MILEAALKDYFDCKSIIENEKFELKIKLIESKKRYFPLVSTDKVNVLVIFSTSEISFKEIAETIIKSRKIINEKRERRIICNWMVCSKQGGIYLYEALSSESHKRYKNMKNRFVVFNSESGEVSLGPGHIENKGLSSKIKKLLKQYRFREKQEWFKEVCKVFDYCLAIL